LEELGVVGRIILKWIFKKLDMKAWTDLAQDRDRCGALVNAAVNIQVQQNVRNFLTS
jgi:hypothetical protein